MNKLMFGLCAGAMVMLAACSKNASSPTEVAQAVCEGMRDKDAKTVAQYTFKEENDEAALQAFFDAQPGSPDVKFSNFEVVEEAVTVAFTQEATIDGEQKSIPSRMILIKKDGKWVSPIVDSAIAMQKAQAEAEMKAAAGETAAPVPAEATPEPAPETAPATESAPTIEPAQ